MATMQELQFHFNHTFKVWGHKKEMLVTVTAKFEKGHNVTSGYEFEVLAHSYAEDISDDIAFFNPLAYAGVVEAVEKQVDEKLAEALKEWEE